MSAKDKWVRRFSVDETHKHKKGFTIYKITSVLFPLESPEAVSVVSVWKRYSDVQLLHARTRALHAGLRLRGACPPLPRNSYFKRFHKEVIEERAKAIKSLLEFIAEHRLLFTSTDFVNFLQTGYPEPEPQTGGIINAIRSSLHLPIEETPPLEYQTDDDDARSPAHSSRQPQPTEQQPIDETDFISQIPIYEAADVEIRQSPDQNDHKLSTADSFESINSLDSLNSDLYDELSKVTIDKSNPSVRKNVLPDLIIFDAPSTSKFEDYHTMPRTGNSDSETTSLASNVYGSSTSMDERRSSSKLSWYSKRNVLSLSYVDSKTKTEDSYVFEAGYMLNLAARCEDVGDYQRAFECYKSGIEKMLIGVQNDSDPQRRALIKEKTNKYLSYAETIYKNHLCDNEQGLVPELEAGYSGAHCAIPLSMLRRPRGELAAYRLLAVLGARVMLVLRSDARACYAMKVIQKVPNNLTEFDEYFLQRTKETREPILPTFIPYMVSLQAYIETNNLIFLILEYAPGEKLFDYIKNYAKSIPNTPARELNLENVFTEPKIKNDIENDNVDDKISITDVNIEVNDEKVNNNEVGTDSDMSVNELVKNSQKLLKTVDKTLSETTTEVEARGAMKEEDRVGVARVDNSERGVAAPVLNIFPPRPQDVLPPSAVCKWGAEILTAIESLHNSGVICRDLNPSNILLGSRGQAILTYFIHYPGRDMSLAKTRPKPGHVNMYVAPELYVNPIMDDKEEVCEKLCDFWSFGAVMYELLCGVPLSYYHRSIFTSHTILQLPDGLSVEVESLLTQLLTYEPSERLGAGADGIEEVKRHPYFKGVDWRLVYDSWALPD